LEALAAIAKAANNIS